MPREVWQGSDWALCLLRYMALSGLTSPTRTQGNVKKAATKAQEQCCTSYEKFPDPDALTDCGSSNGVNPSICKKKVKKPEHRILVTILTQILPPKFLPLIPAQHVEVTLLPCTRIRVEAQGALGWDKTVHKKICFCPLLTPFSPCSRAGTSHPLGWPL